MEIIENKVAKSGLITLDLQQFLPEKEIVDFDLKDYLYMELMLREKEFRAALDELDWSKYSGKVLAVYCSTDAIIAHWAYMLVATHAMEAGAEVRFGTKIDVQIALAELRLAEHDWNQYEGNRVLVKGCSDKELHPAVYLEASKRLLPVTERLMYGEACSFVPVFRKKKNKSKS